MQLRRRLLVVIASITALIILYTLRDVPEPDFNKFSLPAYLAGSWQPRIPAVNSSESLLALTPGASLQNATAIKIGWERQYQVASWEWVGVDGRKAEWDALEFLVDALKRPGGVIIVGGELKAMGFLLSTHTYLGKSS